jgi:hypothetical protein
MNQRKISQKIQESLKATMVESELRTAMTQGIHNKSPGEDGICTELYFAYWEIAKSDLPMFSSALQQGNLDRNQSAHSKNCSAENCKALPTVSLSNGEYKILATIVANRLRLNLTAIMHPAQSNRTPGHTIPEAVATIRDAIANGQMTKRP